MAQGSSAPAPPAWSAAMGRCAAAPHRFCRPMLVRGAPVNDGIGKPATLPCRACGDVAYLAGARRGLGDPWCSILFYWNNILHR